MSRTAAIALKGAYKDPPEMWISTLILQELSWRLLNDDVEIFLPIDFTRQLVFSNLFRGYGIEFSDYSLIIQEKCIRHFLGTAKKYYEKILIRQKKGKIPFGEEGTAEIVKLIDLLESRLKELSEEIEIKKTSEKN